MNLSFGSLRALTTWARFQEHLRPIEVGPVLHKHWIRKETQMSTFDVSQVELNKYLNYTESFWMPAKANRLLNRGKDQSNFWAAVEILSGRLMCHKFTYNQTFAKWKFDGQCFANTSSRARFIIEEFVASVKRTSQELLWIKHLQIILLLMKFSCASIFESLLSLTIIKWNSIFCLMQNKSFTIRWTISRIVSSLLNLSMRI